MGINVRVSDMSVAHTESLMTRAKSVDLESLMDSLQITYRQHQGSISSMFCPNCLMSSRNSTKLSINKPLWKCWSCGKGGSVIDYAMYYWQISETEAAQRLADMQGGVKHANLNLPSEYRKPDVSAKPAEKKKPLRDFSSFLKKLHYEAGTFNKEAYDYLIKVRKISKATVDQAVYRGMIRFLPSNPHEAAKWLLTKFSEAQLRSLGLWTEKARFPWIAMRPMIFFLPGLTSAEFRIIKDDSDNKKSIRIGHTENPYLWKGESHLQLAIVEGMIDLLSLVDMKWKYDIKALPGAQVFQSEWIDGEWKRVAIFTDKDKAGVSSAEKIVESANELGKESFVRHPPAGDVNKELVARQ